MSPEASASLELKISLYPDRAALGARLVTEVLLRNVGDDPLLVNARFSLGYPDTAERDLYCEILRVSGERYFDYRRFQVDYHAQSLSRETFATLRPGDELRTSFELQKWYPITEPGVYCVRVIYEPEPYAPVREAASGRFSSDLVRLTIEPAAPLPSSA